jgi:hypothetical protein
MSAYGLPKVKSRGQLHGQKAKGKETDYQTQAKCEEKQAQKTVYP